MNYFQHNDSRGMESRLRVEAWRAERAKSADFDGTLLMSRHEIRDARVAAWNVAPKRNRPHIHA